MSAPRAAHFGAVLDAYQSDRRLPSLVAGVLADGALEWTGSAGAVTGPDVQYRIGSITKTLTAVLVLQCRDDGLLSLDDELGRHLPESGYRDAPLWSLLGHVSGMQSEPVGPWWERSPGMTVERLLEDNDGSGAVFKPLQTYHYSNLGFALLGEVVARRRGVPWASLVIERVCAPLGMRRTSYQPVAPSAPGHSVHHLAGTLSDEPIQDTGAMAPAGQLWSTITDLATFAGFLVIGHPAVLAPASVREMVAPGAVAQDYGLGVKRADVEGRVLVGHLGSMPGFQASLFVDPSSGEGVAALTNATTGFSGIELTRLLLGSQTPAPVAAWVPSASVPGWVAELLGYWHWGNSAFEARWSNGSLELHDLARRCLAERFEMHDGSILGVEGYHHGETLHVVRRAGGSISHLDCATFIYTRTPYDPNAPIPGP